MPSRPQSTRQFPITALKNGLITDLFFCPSCDLWRLPRASKRALRTRSRPQSSTLDSGAKQDRPRTTQAQTVPPLKTQHRQAFYRSYSTTLASSTAVNRPISTPPANRNLYSALQALNDTASDHVNQSRLQLALRGLESVQPTIRIGILGLGRDGETAARRLARVLLADPLGPEESWEGLLDASKAEGKALLLRYGNQDDIAAQNPLLETLNIPSRVLQRNNLEILITPLNMGEDVNTETSASNMLEAVLVPPLQTPVASTGRAGFVRYPVHKALVVGEGIQGCMTIGQLAQRLGIELHIKQLDGLVQPVVDMPLGKQKDNFDGTIDIQEASAGLELFRQDVANGPSYSHKWQASGMPTVMEWLVSHNTAAGTSTSDSAKALHAHIRSTLDATSSSIKRSELAAQSTLGLESILETTRTHLQGAIGNWAQHAHTDLQQSLARAFESRSWRRTSWVRLLWRVDDVGVAAEDVLRSYWLLDAESGLAFLAGRVEQAGFFRSNEAASRFAYNPDYALTPQSRAVDSAGDAMTMERTYITGKTPTENGRPVSSKLFSKDVKAPTTPELLKSDEVLQRIKEEGGIDMLHSRPWPLAIHFTRQKMLYTLVPALQARAQALLLQSMTTIGATSALGAWFYVATYGVGIYEAGAIALLGLVWTLRRLQKKWEQARSVFAGEVKEGGRVVLSEVENTMRIVVRDNERSVLRGTDVADWAKAREAVARCEKELEKMR